MTVAAFMAVAAASYAAVTPGNGGYEFSIGKDAQTAEQTFTLKKGTYNISVSEGSVAVDGNALTGGILEVAEQKDYVIKVTLAAPAGGEGKKVTLTIDPVTASWKNWLVDQQNTITNLMSEASNLGKGDGVYGTEAEKQTEAGWRSGLIERISAIQKAKNECGITEYNEWLESDKVVALSGLDLLKTDVKNATKNKTAFDRAIAKYTEEKKSGKKLDYSVLKGLYDDLGADEKEIYISSYTTLINDIDNLEEDAWSHYIQKEADANFSVEQIAAKISDLNTRISNLKEAIESGDTNLANYAEVDGLVRAAIAHYNDQFNGLYSQFADKDIAEGYGFDIYEDYYYNRAVAELNVILAKINKVKKANDDAKTAFDEAKEENPTSNPEIKGISYYQGVEWTNGGNEAWPVETGVPADDNYGSVLQAVYDKYIYIGAEGLVPAGTNDSEDMNTLRGAYRSLTATIASLRTSLSVFDAAKADTDTDKNGNKISTYYIGKVNSLNTQINNLETKIKNANKAHTTTTFNIDTEGKNSIDNAKSFLDTQKAEYDKYVATRNKINTLENKTFKEAKDLVDAKKYQEYIANQRFTKTHIDNAISAFKTDARRNYKVENGNGMAANYNSGKCVTENYRIEGLVDAWKTAAFDAYDRYKDIYDEIAGYDLEISGRAAAEGVPAIVSWREAVPNENVTVDGVVPSADTYGARKDAKDFIVTGARTALKDAMDVVINVAIKDEAKESEFVTKLTDAYNKQSEVSGATSEIQSLKSSYSTDLPVWQIRTNYQASKDAVRESKDLVSTQNALVENLTYSGDDYGTEAAKTLNKEVTRIKNEIKKLNDEIGAVNIPDNIDDFDEETAATAIAQINEIREKLTTVSVDIKTLTDEKDGTAVNAKTNFSAVKNAIDNIKDQINGRWSANVAERIASILELLYPAANSAITTMVGTATDDSSAASLNGQAAKLWEDLNAAPVVANARKDKPASEGTPAVDGLDTRCSNLLALVNDYRKKATNESINQTNKNAWDEFLKNPYNDKVPASAQSIIDNNKSAIDDAKAGETTTGESYFQGLIGDATAGKQKDYNDILTAVNNLYGAKLEAPDDAFTDPAKNLTDAKLVAKKNAVIAILDAVKTYPGLAKKNEEAYAVQNTEYSRVVEVFEELRLDISSKEPSGSNYTETYKNTLAELKNIQDDLNSYRTNKDAEYAQGESEAFDSKLTHPKISGIENALKTLVAKWNADETTDGSYLKAVADDNTARYNEFLSAAQQLKDAYYGVTKEGAVHTDGAIDIVSKLSKLSYANQVDPNQFAELVSGADGIYAYADKITDLMARASENKSNTVAPSFWDMDGTFKTEAEDFKDEVDDKMNQYAALVNAVAKKTYEGYVNGTDGIADQLEKARVELKKSGVNLAANDAAANRLLDAVKSQTLVVNRGAVTIYNDAVDSYNGGTPKADFAYRLDTEFIPGFNETPDLISQAMDKAARESWKSMCDRVDTEADAAAMADFMWNENYSTATDLESFTKGGAPTDFAYDDIVYDGKFEGYAAAKIAYGDAIGTRWISGANRTHTKEYWAAYDSNKKYIDLHNADQALQAKIESLTGKLNSTKAGIKDLLVEHDVNLVALLEQYQSDINNLKSASAGTVIENNINNLDASAIYKELQAINVELSNMRSYIELNIDENDRAELVEEANALQTRNERIYFLFSVGEGDPIRVKTPAAETYESYRALEKEIGALKLKYDTTVADAAAKVAEAISVLDGIYAELEEQYGATFTQTQDHYAEEFNAIKPQIDAVKAKVDAQGDAISIEKDNNLKAIANATSDIKQLSEDLSAYNQDYIDTDNFVKDQRRLLEQYENTDLVSVVAKGESLKNKRLFNPKQQDSPLYVTSAAEEIKNSINGYEENSIIYDGVKDDLNDLINYVKKSNYSTKKQSALSAVKGIHNDIVSLEKAVLKYDLTAESQNVLSEIQSVQAEIEARIPDGAELRNTLTGNVTTQNGNKSDVDDFMKKVYNEGYMDNGSWVSLDIVAEHQGVMDRYAGILNALADIQDDIVTPGAVGDLENVTSRDINAIIGFILDPSTIGDKLSVADIDGDKEITVADLIKVQNYYLYNDYSGFTPKAGMSAVRGVVSTNLTAGTLDMDINGSFLSVSLDTKMGYAAIQLDVTLPSGVALTDAAFAGAIEGVQVMHNKIGENTWRVLLFSEDNSNLVDGADLLSVSLAGQGVGTISVNNAKGSTTRGILVPIPGDSEEKEISTGIDAPAEIADGSSFFYNVNAAVQRSIEKGITIVKEAGNKVKKVFSK